MQGRLDSPGQEIVVRPVEAALLLHREAEAPIPHVHGLALCARRRDDHWTRSREGGDAQPGPSRLHGHAPAFAAGRRVVVAIIDEGL